MAAAAVAATLLPACTLAARHQADAPLALAAAPAAHKPNPPGNSTTTTSPTLTSTTITSTTAAPSPSTTTAPTTAAPAPTALAPATTVGPVRTVEIAGTRNPTYGFAEQRGLTGGMSGASYVVTSAADSGPGTYRDALARGDRYVTFSPSLDGATIRLSSPVSAPGSNLTVDAAGRRITISGFATKFSGTNVVVAGLTFANLSGSTNEDAVTFRSPSTTQVFGLFGNTFRTATDGLVDVIWNDGRDVYATVCGNRFTAHDKAMLVHSGDATREGGTYHVTVCRNHWLDVYQRAPFTRDARVHQYNDVFERYGKPDGAGGGSKSGSSAKPSEHLLQHNVAVPRAVGERTWDGSTVTTPRREYAGPHSSGNGRIRIEGSMLLSTGGITATQVERDRDLVARPSYSFPLVPASATLRRAVVAAAGTCPPVSDGTRQVNPCGAFVHVAAGGTVTVTTTGTAASVTLALDGRRLGDAAAAGSTSTSTTWAFRLDPALVPAGTVGRLTAVATATDGSTRSTSPVVLAVG